MQVHVIKDIFNPIIHFRIIFDKEYYSTQWNKNFLKGSNHYNNLTHNTNSFIPAYLYHKG
jgi:hypothetical protein